MRLLLGPQLLAQAFEWLRGVAPAGCQVLGAEMGVWCLPEMNSQRPAQSFRSKLRTFSKPNSLKGQDDHRQRVAGKIPEERSLTICRNLLQDRPNAAMTSDVTLPASPCAPHSPNLRVQGPVVTTLIRCPVP